MPPISEPGVRNSREFQSLVREMRATVAFLSERGWTPATSSNFSARLTHRTGRYMISRSGIHKDRFSGSDLIVMDEYGRAVEPADEQPSAEAKLHAALYADPGVGAVLHTHSPNSTVLSARYADEGRLVFAGYEILKGLSGRVTHEVTEVLPIFPNSQDMNYLARSVWDYRSANADVHGFLLVGHGLYSWGTDIPNAKKHVEVFEFLFDCLMRGSRPLL